MDAAEREHIGARLKGQRQVRGWTQRQLAEQLAAALPGPQIPELDTLIHYIKRWERGAVGIGPRNQQALAEALGVPQRQLFYPSPDVEDPVRRREFLSATAAVGLSVTPLADSAPTGRRIGAGVVDRLRRRTARLRRLDDVLGGTDTYPVYASELTATRTLMGATSYSETTRQALLGVMAEQAQQAGWAALDAGRMGAARALYRDSMTAAAEAGNTALMGNALALLSYQRVSSGQRGHEEADAACRMVDPATPAPVRALLHERAAWAHAMAGAAHTRQVEQALGAAQDAIADAAADTPDGPDWARWVDDVELQIMTGRCWTILRRPDRAVPALTWALDRYPDTHARDKSLYLSWLADAHVEARDFDRAAHALGAAIDLGADVASARPALRVRAVAARLRPHAAAAAVAQVLDRARAMCGSPS